MTASKLEPMILEPILKEKVWGGRRLGRYAKPLPSGVDVGESWEVADLSATSASGGGGGEAHSRVLGGRFAGRTLDWLVRTLGTDLLGAARPTPGGAFPLLVKYLDAREHLSVQVHPSPAYAAAHPEAHLKTESWYVLEAEPGSVIYKGVRPGVTQTDMRRAVERGAVPELLEPIPAVPGDCHTLPSGTVHALGAGVLVAEIQTPSDTTFRLYDWTAEYARPERAMHVEEALGSMLLDPCPPPARLRAGHAADVVAETAFYSVTAVRLGAHDAFELGRAGVAVVMAVAAPVTIACDTPVHLERGQTALVPAALASEVALTAADAAEALVARLE